MSASRVAVLRTIAERYHELTDPMQARDKQGDGVKAPLMPRTYTPTVKEFERLTGLMRDQHHDRYTIAEGKITTLGELRWHLLAWYVDVTTTIRRVPIRLERGRAKTLLKDARGKPIDTRPIRIEHRHPRARKELADTALIWLADHWTARHEPMLPDEIL